MRMAESIWTQTTKDTAPAFRALPGDARTDALVIGGGMAGILCAHRLKAAGVRCIVTEGGRIGGGTTGNTTAKISAQHGLLFGALAETSGPEPARRYWDVNQRAIEEYRALAQRIPCDLEDKTAFVYSRDSREKLEREAAAYQRLGIPGHISDDLPLPLKTRGAIGMPGQAQFHPLKLLYGLARDLDIYEDTLVLGLEGNRAITQKGSIAAEHIILATHYPMVNIPGLYAVKLYQHRSYTVALQDGPDIDGMYVDEREEGHSFRNYKDYLFVGGGDHRTGKAGGGYATLRALAAEAYPGREIRFAWATQDCMSLDSVPYIGVHRRSTPHLYVATGFNKWGMTGSMAAAMTLTDLILRGKSDNEALFSPQRSMFHPQLAVNVGSAIAGLLRFGTKRCTHMGCGLCWNEEERSWDCPCHGSRFDEEGHVLNNPAQKDLRLK